MSALQENSFLRRLLPMRSVRIFDSAARQSIQEMAREDAGVRRVRCDSIAYERVRSDKESGGELSVYTPAFRRSSHALCHPR